MYIHTYHNILYSCTCTYLARTRNDLARTCHHFARICQECARIAPFPRLLCTHARTSVQHATHFLLCPRCSSAICTARSSSIQSIDSPCIRLDPIPVCQRDAHTRIDNLLPATAILRGCSTRFRALPDPGSLTEANWTAPPSSHRSFLVLVVLYIFLFWKRSWESPIPGSEMYGAPFAPKINPPPPPALISAPPYKHKIGILRLVDTLRAAVSSIRPI